MTTAVIVQARLGSSRLPGKVLLPLGNGTVLSEVLRRCSAIPGIDLVVCAVPEGVRDDPVADEARRHGAVIARGHETDVLDRYIEAAKSVNADVIMRVTSDCPLIDPELCGSVLKLCLAEHVDYACNNLPPSYPHGLDCEVFTRSALEMAWLNGKESEDREHVTPWLRRAPEIRRANLNSIGGQDVHMRWTLDFQEDYAFLSAVFALLANSSVIPGWQVIKALLSQYPEVQMLNEKHRQR